MFSQKRYAIQFVGDWPNQVIQRKSLEDCFDYLLVEFDFGEVFQSFRSNRTFYQAPDQREDRILIWERPKDEMARVIWHFSGSDFPQDASDVPGGPLPQGKLPGQEFTLYEMAVA